MIRRIIKINAEKCNGCGLCVTACHEGAIGLENGKAILLRDDYCDGLGDCLPACPENAISFEEREALAYDEEAVLANMAKKDAPLPCNCPGSMSKILPRFEKNTPAPQNNIQSSALRQWPVQIKLVPSNAPYFANANLLVAADCAAYAYGNFHADFIQGKITLIGCPKLDMVDYQEKLLEILKNNSIKSVTVVRMTVPCCAGIEKAAQHAVSKSGKSIPLSIVSISPEGQATSQTI